VSPPAIVAICGNVDDQREVILIGCEAPSRHAAGDPKLTFTPDSHALLVLVPLRRRICGRVVNRFWALDERTKTFLSGARSDTVRGPVT
jgi:hypothetical protein